MQKFEHPNICADGSDRASVPLKHLEILWINTGTLCNIACANCYIESTPINDRLSYITRDEVARSITGLAHHGVSPASFGITGGEPFMNPYILEILHDLLGKGGKVLLLSNAMKPLQRPHIMAGLKALSDAQKEGLTIRVSLDDATPNLHDKERGAGSFAMSCSGIEWLLHHGFQTTIAGRLWNRDERLVRENYAALFAEKNWPIDAQHRESLMLFPEMEEETDPPEITTACWGILNKSPNDIMCSNSRMLVKRAGAKGPSLVACTLLPYDERFDLGEEMGKADQAISLQHPWCASFCVLGGGACSA